MSQLNILSCDFPVQIERETSQNTSEEDLTVNVCENQGCQRCRKRCLEQSSSGPEVIGFVNSCIQNYSSRNDPTKRKRHFSFKIAQMSSSTLLERFDFGKEQYVLTLVFPPSTLAKILQDLSGSTLLRFCKQKDFRNLGKWFLGNCLGHLLDDN
jgi:hypothetical protein